MIWGICSEVQVTKRNFVTSCAPHLAVKAGRLILRVGVPAFLWCLPLGKQIEEGLNGGEFFRIQGGYARPRWFVCRQMVPLEFQSGLVRLSHQERTGVANLVSCEGRQFAA
jgi:hypothetical protein